MGKCITLELQQCHSLQGFHEKATNYNKSGQIANLTKHAILSILPHCNMADSDLDKKILLLEARVRHTASLLSVLDQVTMDVQATKLNVLHEFTAVQGLKSTKLESVWASALLVNKLGLLCPGL